MSETRFESRQKKSPSFLGVALGRMGVVSCLVPFEPCRYGCGSAMAATVAATSVEATTTTTTTTVEAAAAHRSTAAHCAAVESTADRYVRRAAMEAANCTAPDVAVTMPAVPAAVPAVPGTSPVAWASPAAVEPRTCADEDTAGEVARAVVSVRRALVRVIPIVAVGANGSWTNVPRSYAYAHNNALGASVRCQGQGSSKYRKNHQIFHEVFHIWAPSEPVEPFWLLLLFDAPGCFRWHLIVKHDCWRKVALWRTGSKVWETWELGAPLASGLQRPVLGAL
jgi:hypothetical protein